MLIDRSYPGGDVTRGWFVLESDSKEGDVASLNMENLSFQLASDEDNLLTIFGA